MDERRILLTVLAILSIVARGAADFDDCKIIIFTGNAILVCLIDLGCPHIGIGDTGKSPVLRLKVIAMSKATLAESNALFEYQWNMILNDDLVTVKAVAERSLYSYSELANKSELDDRRVVFTSLVILVLA
ncbi:hypothetical protein PG989_009567 [Apiospora arundinis]